MDFCSNNSFISKIFLAFFCFIGWIYFYSSSLYLRSSSFGISEVENITKVVILVWTPYFGRRNRDALSIMAIHNRSYPECFQDCEITYDRKRVEDAQALVFHAWRSDLTKLDLPKNRTVDQLWVFLEQESPILARKDLDTFSGIFNWTMTYRQDSDVYHPYSKISAVAKGGSANYFNYGKNDSKLEELNVFLSGKSKLVAGVISKCSTDSEREVLIDKLKKQGVSIDIFGKCGIESCPHAAGTCSESEFWTKLAKDYKFYLAFENAICLDYVTEKLFRTLELGLVPIVYGGANYTQIAPPNSFIDVNNFKSSKQLADFLINLDRKPGEYGKYFEWRTKYKVMKGDGWCTLCKKVRKQKLDCKIKRNTGYSVSKTYENLKEWWFHYPSTTTKKIFERKLACEKPGKFT